MEELFSQLLFSVYIRNQCIQYGTSQDLLSKIVQSVYKLFAFNLLANWLIDQIQSSVHSDNFRNPNENSSQKYKDPKIDLDKGKYKERCS